MKLCVYTVDTSNTNDFLWNRTLQWVSNNGYIGHRFTKKILGSFFHPSWEKVARAQFILRKSLSCDMLMWMDADVVINNPYFSVEKILMLYPSATIIGACNSPTGMGFQCDKSCCHVKQKEGCFNSYDIGNFSPYPCLINTGVFFIRNNIKGLNIVDIWMKTRHNQQEKLDPFFEQDQINDIRNRFPSDFIILGGQVFNTHSIFDPKHTGHSLKFFDKQLRIYTGFEEQDKLPKYKSFNMKSGFAPCIGSNFFICHNFARIDKNHVRYDNLIPFEYNFPKTAVCISGTLRTFTTEDVQLSFMRLHRPGYEYYVSTNKKKNGMILIDPIIDWVVRNMDSFDYDETECDKFSCMHRNLLTMVQRYAYCYHSIQTHEHKLDFKYDYILRIRPDHVFYTPLPLIKSKNKIALWDDQIAFSHRNHAYSVLAVPSLTYSTCYNISQWREICSEPILDTWNCSHGTPCEPMNSIKLYSNAKTYNIEYTVNRADLNIGYDFCLKRANLEKEFTKICKESDGSDNICQSCFI